MGVACRQPLCQGQAQNVGNEAGKCEGRNAAGAAQVRIEASGLKKLNLGRDRKPRGPRTSDKLDYNRRTVTRKVTNQRTALAVPTSQDRHSSGNTRSGETEGAGRPHTRAVGKGWLDHLL